MFQYLVACDDVILMKEGSIAEQGDHDTLMKLNMDYAAMFNHFQLGDTPHIEVPVSPFCLSVCLSVSASHRCVSHLYVCSRLPTGRRVPFRGSRRTVNQEW